jgi:hypothetical protein
MGFLDRLLGREEPQQTPGAAGGNRAGYGAQGGAPTPQRSDDEIAVERYRYLLRTAPPETIEQVHEEAFSKLTPEQRKLLFEQLSQNAPAGEQPRGDDPRSLAQSATRAELRQPGTLERSLGGGGGMGFGGVFGSSLLGSVAGYVIGSAIVSSFLPGPSDQQASDGGDSGNSGDSGNGGGSDGSGGDGGGASAAGDASGASADGWGGGGDFGGGGGGDFGGGGGDFGF